MSQHPYNARGDGVTDDWWPIQVAVDDMAAGGGGTVVIPQNRQGSVYRIGQAIRAGSNVSVALDNDVVVRCTGDSGTTYGGQIDPSGADTRQLGQWPTYGCILFGSFQSNNIAQLVKRVPPYRLRATMAGDRNIRLMDARASTDFAVGDIVAINSNLKYFVGQSPSNYPVPNQSQIDVVTSTAGGSLGLKYPVQIGQQAVELVRLTNRAGTKTWPTMLNASGGDTRVPLWASEGASFSGGSWEALNGLPFSAGAGAIDCRIEAKRIVSGYNGAGFGNMMANCMFDVGEERIGRGPLVELSEGSHGNSIRVRTAYSSSHTRVIGLNESARDNLIDFGDVVLKDASATDVVQIWNSRRNTVHIRDLAAAGTKAAIVSIAPWPFAGAPDAEGNVVIIGRLYNPGDARRVFMSDQLQRDNLIRLPP